MEVPEGYIATYSRAQYTSHTWCRQYKTKKTTIEKRVFQIRYRR